MTISQTYVLNNHADGVGGGIRAILEAEARLFIDSVTFADNSSHGDGGGSAFEVRAGLARVINSTVSGNRSNGNGGGMFVDGTSGEVNVSFATITENIADVDGLDGGEGGGIATTRPLEHIPPESFARQYKVRGLRPTNGVPDHRTDQQDDLRDADREQTFREEQLQSTLARRVSCEVALFWKPDA